ncbi:MAG: penicillin-binding protein, partial [Polaromonas sp.]|nr:penicillin-binding protein [Polaromonas sp.]
MQMVTAYSVFANGGYRVNPYLIAKVTDQRGKVLLETKPLVLDESSRTITARNAFIMDSLLQDVARSGTAAKAQAMLKRPDLFGKTGTTNDSIDTWFVGFQPTLAAAVWLGYDMPKKLGDRETGGGLSLPIWINFMEYALKGIPVVEYPAPEGVVNVGGEWYYNEYARGSGVNRVGGSSDPSPPGSSEAPASSINDGAIQVLPPTDERKRILDLFKN